MTVDELTLKIFQEIKDAITRGNLLGYANDIAKKMIGQTAPIPEEITRGAGIEPTNDSLRPSTPQARRASSRQLDTIRVNTL